MKRPVCRRFRRSGLSNGWPTLGNLRSATSTLSTGPVEIITAARSRFWILVCCPANDTGTGHPSSLMELFQSLVHPPGELLCEMPREERNISFALPQGARDGKHVTRKNRSDRNFCSLTHSKCVRAASHARLSQRPQLPSRSNSRSCRTEAAWSAVQAELLLFRP